MTDPGYAGVKANSTEVDHATTGRNSAALGILNFPIPPSRVSNGTRWAMLAAPIDH
jgi:hypothetical protein